MFCPPWAPRVAMYMFHQWFAEQWIQPFPIMKCLRALVWVLILQPLTKQTGIYNHWLPVLVVISLEC